jgi:hypothetical protein
VAEQRALPLIFETSGTQRVSINAAGSSSFTANVLASAADAATINLKQNSTTANTGIYLERSGEQKGYYIYMGGSADSLTFQRNNAGTKGDVMALTRDGNVGIGTTSPSQKLEVVGGEIKAGRVDSSNEGGQLSFGRASDNNTAWYIDAYGNAASPQLRFVNVDNAVVAMTITGSNVGIGTSSPNYKFEVNGISASTSGFLLSSGQYTSISGVPYIGMFATEAGSSDGFGALLISSRTDAARPIIFGTSNGSVSTERMRITSGGEMQINTTIGGINIKHSVANKRSIAIQKTSGDVADFYIVCDNVTDNKFLVNGAGTIYAVNTTVQSASDIRFKENIRDLETGLSEILALKPRRFDWKEGKGMNIKNSIGFIAQEVEEVLPDLVKDDWINSPSDNTSYKSLGMTNMIPTLVKAIQELSAKVDAQAAKINALETK